MAQDDKVASALLAAFPTVESFISFYQNNDNSQICDSLIAFASRNDLIESPDLESLEDFLRGRSRPAGRSAPAQAIDFEELLNKKGEMLRLHLSLRALCSRINTLLASCQVLLPRVTNSMLIRLKKEPLDTTYKQNVMRSFAFWLGYERADLSATWHFDTLTKLFREGRQTQNFKEGVRIGFSLSSRGEVIDHEIISWLKKTIKSYIEQSISQFLYGRWGRVRLHDITTLYIDFPKEEEAGNLVAYRECLRSAVALAHQIAVRWVLSKYGTKNRFLSIAIVAGDFANLDNHLLPLLNARLPGDPVIRLSDYARQCLLINDIRTILCPKPTETTLFNGESLPIWWITGLWTTLYFDFVSDLLEDDILQTGAQSVEKLDRFLWSPEEYRITGQEGGRDSAVATFFKFPHNSLLGVEIAKTLYYRRRFSEAAEILRIVLSINPTDLVARTLRMVLFRNMALDAPSHHAAAAIFRQAKQEADYIRENCDFQAEDFYCEYGAVYLAEAMSTVRYTRTSPEIAGDAARMEKLRAEVYSALDQAQYLFERGMSVSPSGIRASYLLNSAAVLKAILSSDEELFFNAEKPIAGEAGIGHEESTDVQWQIGYRRSDVSGRDLEFLAEKMMITKGAIHDSSISLHSYRPTTYFCNAVALWDFLPVRTVLTAKKVMERIRGAMEIARRAQKENVCIYSFTRTYGEMIPAEEYIQHMEKALKMIEEAGGGDLGGREDSEILPAPPGGRQPLLLTLNF
ncbi:MAG: hypothetical protein K4445_01020 [Deltaproteobacteria bacterium]